MLNLNGILNLDQLMEVTEYTRLRIQDAKKYKCAEAVALYEQHLLPEREIISLCEKEYGGVKLETPSMTYVPPIFITQLRDNPRLVPVSYNKLTKELICAALPEFGTEYVPISGVNIKCVYVPIYLFFRCYVAVYGMHPDLLPIPARTMYDSIIQEAIDIGAADITISTVGTATEVYYNVRKKKVYSHLIMGSNVADDIIKILTIKSPIVAFDNDPKYIGVSLNNNYRGRVVINRKFGGWVITIRVLDNSMFDKTLEDCRLKPQTIRFMRDNFMNRENGLRIVAGPTMAGKNTTMLACLNELAQTNALKIVSVEMPVEQVLQGVEQINCDNIDEYKNNINSLIRQNPDFLYITEMNDDTGTDVMRAANTGKRSVSTIHANSCGDVIARLLDITTLSLDRIIQPLHSIVYQELHRIEELDILVPVNRFVYLSQERKNQLYGKPFGEVIMLINSWEGGDVW